MRTPRPDGPGRLAIATSLSLDAGGLATVLSTEPRKPRGLMLVTFAKSDSSERVDSEVPRTSTVLCVVN